METVDLYQIHRWDYDTPVEETLRALDISLSDSEMEYLEEPYEPVPITGHE